MPPPRSPPSGPMSITQSADFDHIQLMFDHNDSIAEIHQALEHVQKSLHVLKVQAGGWLIQDVERSAGLALA